jgi:benzoate/toluate 1,2-dioxygenase alpha subunit
MEKYNSEHLASLVKIDRVHRDYYTDPRVFDIEIEKIFEKVWVYVGHDSLIPNVGDYYTTTMARQPVVMTRHTDNKVYVLMNRCGHRGALVAAKERGNARALSCMYHGWTFRMNGEIAGVPMRKDFPEACLEEPESGMLQVARVDSYRGFVFASFNPDVMPLLDFLGASTDGIDELVNRSPEGRVEFSSGVHRYSFRGNWKFQMDNMADTYHPAATHGSTVGTDGRQFQRRAGKEGGRAPFFAENGESIVSQLGVRGFPNGHSSEQSLFDKPQSGGEGFDEYRARLVEAYGEEKTVEILKNVRHSLTIFPILDILIAQTSVRVVKPISVDETIVEIWPVKLLGAPASSSADIVKFVNISHSASSYVQTDDMEAFERLHKGVQTGGEYTLVAKGLGQEVQEDRGVIFGARSSEVGQRAKHYAWRDLMSASE